MIFVDTSAWIDHLRSGEPSLAASLEGGRVLMHPFVLGELACGNPENRGEVLRLLGYLPSAPTATDPEVLGLIERRALMGRGSATSTYTFWPRRSSPVPDGCGRETNVWPRWPWSWNSPSTE